MTEHIRFGAVSLDCADPHPLADFWAAVIDGEVAFRSDSFDAVKAGSIWLTAVKVDNYQAPTWPEDELPKQMHLDLAVTDLAEGEREVLALGATRATTQPAPEAYLVFFDPAGHPFCLSTGIPD
ncbi:MAG: VOC family protein [Acidimicrobiales bacterium]